MTPAEYTAKWRDQSGRAMARALLAGEGIVTAAERIHRRYHRAMTVAELNLAGMTQRAYLTRRRLSETSLDRVRAAIINADGTVRGIDRSPSQYWHNNASTASAGRDEYGGPSEQVGNSSQSVIGVPRCGGEGSNPPDISPRASGQIFDVSGPVDFGPFPYGWKP